MTAQTRKAINFIPFSLALLLTGCPLNQNSSNGAGSGDSGVDPYEDPEAVEQCEDLAYWLCGHGEPCLNGIPVDECTDAVARDLRCWDATGVNENYEQCGRDVVDWDCDESDAPLSCQDAIVYSDDPGDTERDTDTPTDTDTSAETDDAEAKCEAVYTNLCEKLALCAADGMGDLSVFTPLRNQCIEANEPLYHCEDAVGVSEGYPACLLAIVSVDCNAGEQTVDECEDVILYE